MPNIQILRIDVSHALTDLNPRKAYGPDGVPPIFLKNCASMLRTLLGKTFLSLLINYSYCWKYAYIQTVRKKDGRSNLSNYRPIVLISYLFKVFESLLNRKIQRHLSNHDLLFDRQYGFRSGRSTGDILTFLTDSFKGFGETLAVASVISKVFDRVWHRALISKLPFFGFYPSLCSFISNFLSDSLITTVVDDHCSSPKPINSGVPQSSVLSHTFFLLFINDLLNLTQCPIHSFADDSTSFSRHQNQKQGNDSRGEATERLTSDLFLISDWSRENFVLFNVSQTQFLHLSTRQNLPDNYPLYFDDTHLSPSSTLNILGLSSTKTLNWMSHISFLAISASNKLGVLCRLHQFFSPYQLLTLYRSLIRPYMEYTLISRMGGLKAHRTAKQG